MTVAPIVSAPVDAVIWDLGNVFVWEDSVELLRAVQATGLKCVDFGDHVISSRVGLVKPDPAIFRLLLDRHGLLAERCLFVDDNEANIVTAKSLGFVTHRFTEPIRLRAFFYRVGVLQLPELGEWQHSDHALRRSFSFDGFASAWAFMQHVAEAAEQLDHHPDWSNSWNKVDISLTTHDRKAVTHLDYALAHEIERILECS